MAQKDELKTLIERRHPRYSSLVNHWTFLEQTYHGGREWFDKNVHQYMKEGEDEFKSRVKRAYRFNHTREVVDLVNKYLFRQRPQRNQDDAPESVRSFWSRSTVRGLDISEFVRATSTKSSIYGRPWVIVDSSVQETDVEVRSLADEENAEDQIYAYVVAPQDVLDMAYDDQGVLLWLLVREVVRDDADPFESTGVETYRYRLWTRTEWYLVEKDGDKKEKYKISDNGDHKLGRVPAVQVDNCISDDPYDSPALIADIAYLDRACANYASNLDAIIQDQTFSQLAMPAQGLMPGEDDYKKMLEVGTKRVFLYDAEGGGVPFFLSPDPRQAQLIIAAIQQIINEIYHSVGLAGERTKADNAKGIDNSSGVAKSKDFERVNALLSSKADSLEMVENKIVELVCLWAGDELPEEDLVSYPDNFDTRELYDEFYIAMQLSLINVPDMVRNEQLKTVIDKLFPQLKKELKEKMLKEAESWNPSDEGGDFDPLKGEEARLIEEAKRDREASGQMQSKTKSRETGKSTKPSERETV